MTLSKDNNENKKPPQNRTQKIVQWSIYGVAAVLLVVAVVIFLTHNVRLF